MESSVGQRLLYVRSGSIEVAFWTLLFLAFRLPLLIRYATNDEANVMGILLIPGWKAIIPHTPGTTYLFSAFVSIFGSSEFAFRFGPFLFSYASLILLIYICKHYFRNEHPLIYSLPLLLYTLVPISVNNSVFIDVDTGIFVFFTLCWYLLTLGPSLSHAPRLRFALSIACVVAATLFKETVLLFGVILLAVSSLRSRSLRAQLPILAQLGAGVISLVAIDLIPSGLIPATWGTGLASLSSNSRVLSSLFSLTDHAIFFLDTIFWLTLPLSFLMFVSVTSKFLRREDLDDFTLIGTPYILAYFIVGFYPTYGKYLAPGIGFLFLGLATYFRRSVTAWNEVLHFKNVRLYLLGITVTAALSFLWLTKWGFFYFGPMLQLRLAVIALSFGVFSLPLLLGKFAGRFSFRGRLANPEIIRQRGIVLLFGFTIAVSVFANIYQIASYQPIGYTAPRGVKEAGLHILEYASAGAQIFAWKDIAFYAQKPNYLALETAPLFGMDSDAIFSYIQDKITQGELKFFAYGAYWWQRIQVMGRLQTLLVNTIGVERHVFYDVVLYVLP